MAEPLAPVIETVRKEWIDIFGHMNMAYYVLAFDSATYAFWTHVTRDRPRAEREEMAYAVVEAHINYTGEVSEGQRLRITTRLLDADAKRFRLYHEMHEEAGGHLAATNEVLGLGFNLKTRRVVPFTPPVMSQINEILKIHSTLPMPANAGRAIAIRRGP
jgi:acyl-CoA thioester hydrolase